MGQIDEGVEQATILAVGLLTAAGLAVLLWQGRAMDVATFSDAEAESLGVHLGRLRRTLFFVASLLAAGAVVLAGPIAFIGLICPHLARLVLGPAHRPLLLASALIGAGLIMLADMTSIGLHLTFRWGLMPLGIFTAVLGGICFLWMLRPRLGRAFA
jgi:iron complex transport system permease protein